ncbi:hypothetical protein MELE44368_20735 [Mycolicibacterium elephantis DSM 44368]|uniref:Uncharacterized protein n=1 Tax=Mycolicibacterium elephantis DSM 44368 TaxID=1335622 RepID=A0A439DT15_9MYCO|nr:hypothetical protein MELE44368_20735 [Mycolicibacterium elephantis DSM 44368]
MALVATLIAGMVVVVVPALQATNRIHLTAYFDNSNGIFPGDDVMILGVAVGKITAVEPQPERAKITFWVGDQHPLPADVKAVILSPKLITSRAIQLTPVYSGGPRMGDGEVIPQDRTAVPVEWDDFRVQLEKLSDSLQPVGPGEASPLGAFINTTAANLRGQGPAIRESIIELSQMVSALGDHSGDLFSSVRNLSILVTALHDSADILRQLNHNLASVSGVLSNDGSELGAAFRDLDVVTADLGSFVGENQDTLGTTGDKLASVTQTLFESLDDIKQTLHTAPHIVANFNNIYEPAHGSLSGALAVNNFANPIQFLCGAIQAASRLGAEQAAKLCVQYLAPIVKNRQFNFPPIGLNPFVNAAARPNELTYSEDWLRPDYIPPPTSEPAAVPAEPPPAPPGPALAAERPASTDPADGLPGMMVPTGAGS